jgi:hypothetical protein
VSVTNDTALLFEPLPSFVTPNTTHTVMEFITRIAWAWKAYPSSSVSPYLVNYGPDKRSFLEVCPRALCPDARRGSDLCVQYL